MEVGRPHADHEPTETGVMKLVIKGPKPRIFWGHCVHCVAAIASKNNRMAKRFARSAGFMMAKPNGKIRLVKANRIKTKTK